MWTPHTRPADDPAKFPLSVPAGYPHLALTMVLFGSSYASSKVVVDHLPHQLAAALRFGGAALVLALPLAVGRDRTPIRRGLAIRAGLVGLLGVFAYNAFSFWGLSLAPSLDGALIIPVLSPVLTTTFLVLTGRERTSAPRTLGLIVAVGGASLFFVSASSADNQVTGARLGGDLVYLLAAVCWAAYTIVSKKVLIGVDPLRATAYGTSVGAAALLVAAAPHLSSVEWSTMTAAGWVNVIYLAVGPTAVAYLLYARGLSMVTPSTATTMMFAVPLSGAACSTLFLGESFGPGQLIGALITIAGALLAISWADSRPGDRRRANPERRTSRIPIAAVRRP
ncbi:DMT family transporter [Nocardia sp. CNY236]|uniref:DMT family transporter n=1 Tax=Nocardia sp. CNY236 TaxID=1169152 RepID=UPI00041412BC|nr:DMT family transporter [Nocardia sp. CNY236]